MQAAIQHVARDNEGYLLDPEDWTEELANALAGELSLVLDAERREIVLFVRNYYEENASVPEARRVLKHMKQQWGAGKATRKYLYSLFPGGYGQQACKIAGMRKPLKLMLDV
ncbi:MAG TPA: TusE/DsrC/DsvC family sulfur relay protein [Thiolinea sp.]|nr:TusE/DsrC/DsvC family sulfur relay protein [Thiolinea sp.]